MSAGEPLAPGAQAPDFALPFRPRAEPVRLGDFRGQKPVVLLFFPLAFSAVCTDEMCAVAVEGLDVAHTGIAVWRDGAVHLLNAPLVGKSVEISEKAIPERLAGIKSQDGLVVGRPVEAPLAPAGRN